MTPLMEKEASSAVYRWPPQGKWTYDDYARLPDDGMRYEVIGGDLYMSPAPGPAHQSSIVKLVGRIDHLVTEQGLGQVFVAPVDVILPDRASPVQPDIVYIANDQMEIIGEKLIDGVPDLVIEVLSPSNRQYDRRTKYRLYAEAGVKEYWLFDPEACTADVFALRGNAYVPFGHFTRDDVIQSELLPDLRIPMRDVCPNAR